MDDRPDEYLVAISRGGDRQAFAALVRRHQRRIYGLCYALLGNQADAEDAVQEVFVRSLERLATLRDGSQFVGWISQIARNRCRDLLRVGARRRDLPLAEHHARTLPAPSEDAGEFADLRAALARLPQVHRLPLLLFYYDGKSTRKLAEELHLSEGGACVRLYRARKALRRLLTEEENHA